MKYTIFSNSRRLVEILLIVGGILLCVGIAMQITGFLETHSVWISGIAFLLSTWCAISYIFVNAKRSDLNPSKASKVIATVSFLVLAGMWGSIIVWIFIRTQ